MDALVVFLIYVLPFLTLGLAGSRWMKRNAIGLEEAQAQGTSRRRRHLFLLGVWRWEEWGANDQATSDPACAGPFCTAWADARTDDDARHD